MKMRAWNRCVVLEAEGSTMPKGRRQFTLGGLMVLVAVCGFEVFRYKRAAERDAAMNLATSITDNIYGYVFGVVLSWVVFWVVFRRVRAAKTVAANQVDQEPDRGGTHA
jgi:L-asparagine transporter-like permease